MGFMTTRVTGASRDAFYYFYTRFNTYRRESFECGFQRFGSFIERLCPADPQFPKIEDYDLHFKWQCYAIGKTDMARKLFLSPGFGNTKEEAMAQVHARYTRLAERQKS